VEVVEIMLCSVGVDHLFNLVPKERHPSVSKNDVLSAAQLGI